MTSRVTLLQNVQCSVSHRWGHKVLLQMFLVSCILMLSTWQAVSLVANRAGDKEDVDLEVDHEVEVNIRILQRRVEVKLGFSP